MSPADLFDPNNRWPPASGSNTASTGRPLSDAERLDWLRLIRTDHVGPITFRRLLTQFGTARAALDALPDLSKRGGRRKPLIPFSRAKAQAELAALARLGARTVTLPEPDYPKALAILEDAPPLLHYMGHAGLLSRPCVGVVGSRNASLQALRIAETLGQGLAEAGICVVSGLARGLDTAAHQGALRAVGTSNDQRLGGTAAVIAGGLDVIYPPENADLQQRIALEGIVLSEMPPGERPQARHFPRRNRIVSGVSLGVVVVEGAQRSGSLITARFALEQGREVMAVPGAAGDPRAAGPNSLIKQGAHLVESVTDILKVIEPLRDRPLAEPAEWDFSSKPAGHTGASMDETELAEARRILLSKLGTAPVSVDEIIRRCQLSASVVAVLLLELELAGRLERQPGNCVALLVSMD